MQRVTLVFVGGGLGSVARYLAQAAAQRVWGPSFPAGTLAVNVTGCLLIGVLAGLFLGPKPIAEDYRVAILTGVLGGYTTFSAFGLETIKLTEDGQFGRAGLYVGLSVAAGLAAVWAGKAMVTAMYGA